MPTTTTLRITFSDEYETPASRAGGVMDHLFETFNDDDSLTRIEYIPEEGSPYDLAIAHLREARRLLAGARAPRATDKVRAALRSAEGAKRHGERSDIRARRGAA